MKITINLMALISVFTLLTSCSFFKDEGKWTSRSISSNDGRDYYTEEVKPILDNRCVACHSCNNAPCQLKLSSFDGIDRGANKDDFYDFNYIKPKKPTRLYVDAKTTEQWQKELNFFPIVKHKQDGQVDLAASPLFHVLNLKATNPYSVGNFQAEYSRSCPEIKTSKTASFLNYKYKQIEKYKKNMPWAGMPYGFPALSNEEYSTLINWMAFGAPGPIASEEKDPNYSDIKKWEKFFNGTSIKEKITARYIYEHLIFAHLYFDDDYDNYYEIVRAKNLEGEPDVIATRRPYDDPGSEFYYRIRKIKTTIVHKTHIVYQLSDKKMERYNELFIEADWGTDKLTLPSYGRKTSANPLTTFQQMPSKSRYKFLLDDAQYHVMTFIRGPVCRGQVALNVIDDHFWVMFLEPDSDIFVNDKSAYDAVKKYGTTPAGYGSGINISALRFYKNSVASKEKLRRAKNQEMDRLASDGLSVADIWDGEGHNDNALLTVFRHFDSATVSKGAQGNIPKTIWVLDYLIFEDIYYNLVAGYDVYGATTHQVKTRIHMDHSRINAQDLFLDMLPIKDRRKLRYEWSRDKDSKFINEKPHGLKKFKENLRSMTKLLVDKDAAIKMRKYFPYMGEGRKTKVKYQTNDTKVELINKIFEQRYSSKVRGSEDKLNCCDKRKSQKFVANITSVDQFESEAGKVFGQRGDFTRLFPDVSMVRVLRKDGDDLVYSLIRNVAHWNVTYMMDEEKRLRPEHDTLNLFRGYVGSYPNYFFVVKWEELSDFLLDLSTLKRRGNSYSNFIKRYGVNRMSSRFWSQYDFFNEHFKKNYPLEAGVLDLNRYMNY